jgi:hypothetical protein
VKACIQMLMAAAFLFGSAVTFAWSAPGHETVGSIADSLLVGTNAAKAVTSILGTEKLETASVWADCAKGVTEKPPLSMSSTADSPSANRSRLYPVRRRWLIW